MPGPLEGVRVLDMTWVLLGPYATQILGDLGAEVIKIEGPEGDTTRQTGPMRNPDMASFYLSANRNKRSIVLDMKQPAAKEALLKLVDGADVFVHSIRPDAIDRLGIGNEALLARNPRLVYAAVHGFRRDGPYGGRPAYDDVIQAASGMSALMQRITGEMLHMPMVAADKTTGLTLAYSILAALFHRERTGEGQFVEVPMFETLTSFTLMEHAFGMTFDPPEGPAGYSRVLAKFRRPYMTSDGKYICFLAYNQRQWTRYAEAAGRPDLLTDPDYATLKARAINIERVYALTAEITATQSLEYWKAEFERLELPYMVVNELEDLYEDPHLAATGFFQSFDHPSEGKLTMPSPPTNFAKTPATIRRHPPKLGEQSLEILAEAGLAEDEIAAMLDSGATVDGR